MMGAATQLEPIHQPAANNTQPINDHDNSQAAEGPTVTSTRQVALGPGFCCLQQHPADILANASFVTHFLGEVAFHLHSDGTEPGLSENGAQGLYYILNAVENTINEVINRL